MSTIERSQSVFRVAAGRSSDRQRRARVEQVSGRPTCIQAVPDAPGGPVVVIATSEGEVKGFRVGQP